MRVMISAAGSPLSVSVLRHVRSLGHCVIGLNANVDTEPLGRAFCDEFHIAPKADSPAYLDFLCKRLAEVDVFLPFIDEELVAIGEGWHGFPSDLADRIALSEPNVLLDCVDKCRFQRACEESDLPIAPEANATPAIYKPRYGRGGRGVIEARDSRLFEALQGRDGVLQKAISGDEFTVDAIFSRDGSLIATSPRRRMCTAGISTVGEVGPDKKLHRLAERLGQRWHFRYAINFQVMRDIDDHDWIIELNPRLAGSAIFSALAGCDPFDATIALWKGESWHGVPRRLRVWRYWEERTDDLVR